MLVEIAKVIQRIPADARVLDLGGWDRVFPRANVVVDINPYATRRNPYPEMAEQFTEHDWIIADFCSHAFWKTVGDKEFDFVIISHALEDIRDPLYVCQQMIRCAHAGYIEAPSKFRECAKIKATDSFSGYDHHRWLIEPNADCSGFLFKAKLAWAHHRDYLGDAHRDLLGAYDMQFDGYFWQGSFSYVEHFPKGMHYETLDLEYYFRTVIAGPRPRKMLHQLAPRSCSENDGKCLWVTEYRLPVEDVIDSSSAPPAAGRCP